MFQSLILRGLPLLATALLVVLGVLLGNWQGRRASEKAQLEALWQARADAPALTALPAPHGLPPLYRRLRLQGQFLRDWPLYLENRSYQGRAGFYVPMPFQERVTGRVVLVARGWQARNVQQSMPKAPLPPPADEIMIEGQVSEALGRMWHLKGDSRPPQPGAVLADLRPEVLAARTGWAVVPFYLQQTSAAADGLVRDWPRPAAGGERHLGYRATWYGLAIMAMCYHFALLWSLKTKNNREGSDARR